MNEVFVLPCYAAETSPIVIKSVDSIIRHHPNSKIIIIDSGSTDKSYMETLNNKYNDKIIIEDINNNNYDTGAYWYAFKKYKTDYDYFYFLHDSIIIKSNLEYLKENDFTSLRYFNSFNGIGKKYCVNNKKELVFEYIKYKLKIKKLDICMYGFDNLEQQLWTEKQLLKIGYWIPNVFTSLFGPVLVTNKDIMSKLESVGMDKILPNNKNEQMAMERVWGIVLQFLSIDITKSSMMKNHFKNELENKLIKKVILNRE